MDPKSSDYPLDFDRLNDGIKDNIERFYMTAVIYKIIKKSHHCPVDQVSRKDFHLRAQGKIALQEVAENTNLSLYCLDDKKRVALFVEVPKYVDLVNYRLFYQAQFEYAQRVIEVRYQDLSKLAGLAEESERGILFVFAMQDNEAALLRHLLTSAEGLVYLNQPAIYTQIQSFSSKRGLRKRELAHLLEVCTKIIRSKAMSRENAKFLVIKLRDFNIQLGEQLAQSFPEQKSLFLYRDAVSYTQQEIEEHYTRQPHRFYLAASKTRLGRIIYAALLRRRLKTLRRITPLAQEYPSKIYTNHGILGLIVISWLSAMDRYLRMYRRNIALLPVPQTGLLADPVTTITSIADYCALPLKDKDQIASLKSEWDQSRQNSMSKGSPSMLSSKDVEKINQLVSSHPQIDRVNYPLPVPSHKSN